MGMPIRTVQYKVNRVENYATQSPQLVFPTVNNKNHEIEYVVFKTSLDMKMIFCCFITSILTSIFIQEYMVTVTIYTTMSCISVTKDQSITYLIICFDNIYLMHQLESHLHVLSNPAFVDVVVYHVQYAFLHN